MGSVALTAPDSWGFLSGSTLYAGAVNGFDDTSITGVPANKATTVTSYYIGATVATPVTGLRAGASFDYLDVHAINNDTYSFAGYLSYQATEKLSFHARAEYFKDKLTDAGGTTFLAFGAPGAGNAAEVLGLTGTVQYDLWKNVISRFEVRWDHSLGGNNLFGADAIGNPNQKNAVLVAANVIYKF
jgi:hypothetical protein